MSRLAAILPPAEVVSYLVNLALVVSLVCGVGLLAVRMCRHGSAPLRHGVLLGTLVLILLSPAAVWLAGRNGLALVRLDLSDRTGASAAGFAHETVPPSAAPAARKLAAGRATADVPPPGTLQGRPEMPPEPAFSAPPGDASPAASPLSAAAPPASHSAAGEPSRRLPRESPRLAWWQMAGAAAAWLWAIGTAVALLRLEWGYLALARFCRRLTPLQDSAPETVARRAAAAVGLRKLPAVFLSRRAGVPLSIGLLRPAIVLPEAMPREVDEDQLQAVLLHEAAHIARRDHWVGLRQRLATVLFWWNPLVHRTCDEIAELREEICDNHVVLVQGEGRRLARILVDLAARAVTGPLLPATVGVLEPRLAGLTGRVTRLLEKERNMETRMNLRAKLFVCACSLAALVGMASVGGLRLVEAQSPTEGQPVARVVGSGLTLSGNGTLTISGSGSLTIAGSGTLTISGSGALQIASPGSPSGPEAGPQTWPLALKRRESPDRWPVSGKDLIYRATYPQTYSAQFGKNGEPLGNKEQLAAFKRIVKKEPKYRSACPFRGVARLGSQEFAFALDAVPVRLPAPADWKLRGKKRTIEDDRFNELDAGEAAAGSEYQPHVVTTARRGVASAMGYNRLYFDFNHNGDLTDDKVIEAKEHRDPYAAYWGYLSGPYFQFPRINVTIDAGGTKMDYSFFLTGNTMVSPGESHAEVELTAAVHREGDITLLGKKHRVVLIDFHSRGRFDEQMRLRPDVKMDDGHVYAEPGDFVLVDPTPNTGWLDYAGEVTWGGCRHNLSKLVNIDGRFYNLKISPAGDKLTLTRSSLPLGYVTNPNGDFRAIIYGDQGFLNVCGHGGQLVPVPAGQWKLLRYCINVPKKAPGKQEAEEEKGSLLQVIVGGVAGVAQRRPRHTVFAAQATAAYKAVQVRAGETVVLPFGPPYKPVVKVSRSPISQPYPPVVNDRERGKGRTYLQLTLVGSAGELWFNVLVDGGRPPKPEFIITDPKGKIVGQGRFEYGFGAVCVGSWRVPPFPDKEHHARVKMDGDPFAIDQDNDSVIRLPRTGPSEQEDYQVDPHAAIPDDGR